jgi:hypothetical protein
MSIINENGDVLAEAQTGPTNPWVGVHKTKAKTKTSIFFIIRF